ncbi:MAG: phytanoyl-CoA dioxygenase family protein [Pirellulaceae bacterium]|nr:phytanoyl-CoA dioxygenase family protein [Pirellulaceae bacterium]MDP7018732.1 phytanoyl-CoA dioxygenase family protein [Pirellulaceae bacterium]
MDEVAIQGEPASADVLGALVETERSSSPAALSASLARDGYVFIRGALDRDAVLAAREEVFQRLADVGEIAAPVSDGIGTGRSARGDLPDLGEFWRSVSNGTALREVTHGARVNELLSRAFGEPVRGHDLLYLRPIAPGKATKLHYDFPFFAGFSPRILTAWIPLGDVALAEGPLAIVENSHQFADLIEPLTSYNFAADHSNDVIQEAAYKLPHLDGPMALAKERGVRFLSADFRAGDLMVFGGLTMHGSLDNRSSKNRVRLSVDVRYQSAADRTDDVRYIGDAPQGSKGGGYADMRGAAPLFEGT